MGGIFISYRRDDSAGFAGRLRDRLVQRFPRNEIFMDVDNIAAGADFVSVLEKQVAECDVLLAVIGQNWLTIKDNKDNRRLDNPEDFVRIEIASALRFGKRIIPVLVNEADMPLPDALPEPLKLLARRNAVRLTHIRFKADAQGLVNGLKAALAEAETERARTEAERMAAEEARKKREAEEEARAAQRERDKAEQIQKAEELANWDFIKESPHASDFRDHLARFAGGFTERFARAKLEVLVWADPATQASIEALQTFIEEFPKGEFLAVAKVRLEDLEKYQASARLVEETKRAETEDWAKAATSYSTFDIEDFLKKWPNGAHARAARARIRDLSGSFWIRRPVVTIFIPLVVLALSYFETGSSDSHRSSYEQTGTALSAPQLAAPTPRVLGEWAGEVSQTEKEKKPVQTADLKAAQEPSEKIFEAAQVAELIANGEAYVSDHDYDRAITDYTKAIELDRKDALAYLNRGSAYYKKQDYDRAIADYTKAIKIDPKAADAYYGRGFAYKAKGNDNWAEADFQRAKELGYKE